MENMWGDELRRCMWREEKERKTESEVDGQCKCGLDGEGTVVEATG